MIFDTFILVCPHSTVDCGVSLTSYLANEECLRGMQISSVTVRFSSLGQIPRSWSSIFSVVTLAMGWTCQGLNAGVGKRFISSPKCRGPGVHPASY
jgi:hypothetical protein